MQQPLWKARPGSISLTFTQTQNASQSQLDIEPPVLGMDAEPSLGSSVLGSIVPGLDPEPPDSRMQDAASPAFNISPRTIPEPRSEERSPASGPARGKVLEGPRVWAEGQSPVVAQSSGASTSLSDQRGADRGSFRDWARKRPVEHGHRVLLRGSTRCGKSSILFDYCHRAAIAGHKVVLVSPKRDAQDLVHLPHSMRSVAASGQRDELRGWEASALSRIGLKYVRSRDDLAWYLGSLHTLPKDQWPTVIAGENMTPSCVEDLKMDDLDKIVDTSVAGTASGANSSAGAPSGGAGAGAALRILALLQDIAEFFDASRAGTIGGSAGTDPSGQLPDTAALARFPPERMPPNPDGASRNSLPSGDTPANAMPNREGEDVFQTGIGMGTARNRCTEPTRVVAACAISDRGLLSLYGRFMHVVARVQNTTGPDCFSVRIDPGIGTVQLRRDGTGGDGGGRVDCVADARKTAEPVVEFVRSQLDGSFAMF